MENLFKSMVEKLFKEAGLTKTKAPEMFKECMTILDFQMGSLSVIHGMSAKRSEIYEAQKQVLVEDLKNAAKEGRLR